MRTFGLSTLGEFPEPVPPVCGTPDSSPDAGQPWFAIWTRSRNEPLVCEELRAKGIETFLPTVCRVSRWTDRTKRIMWPLFPGYCFASFPRVSLRHVVTCTGVVTVLSNCGTPVAVPRFEIEALQRLVASGLDYDPCSQLEPGTLVRIAHGALEGVVGRLVRRLGHDELILAVQMLSSGARVRVSPWDVERL